MSAYYADGDLEAYSARLADYDAALAAWQAAHDAWVDDTSDPPLLEPVAPTPPEPPDVTYTVREVVEREDLETESGTALVLPPRLVVTGSDGSTFALAHEDLDAGYTPTTDPLPPARAS